MTELKKQDIKKSIRVAILIGLMYGGYTMLEVATDPFGAVLGLSWFLAAVLNLLECLWEK